MPTVDPEPDEIAGVVLAAGASRRFGSPKQVARLDGRPLLDHALSSVRASTVDRRLIVLGANADQIAGAVDPRGFEVVRCPRWQDGLSASLSAALELLAASARCRAVVVTLADQPLVSAEAIDRLIDHHRATGAPALRAGYAGRPGHPVLLHRDLWPELLREAAGDQGARQVLRRRGAGLVDCSDCSSDVDVDVLADLERVAAGRER